MLSCTYSCFYYWLFSYFLLPFFPNLATTRRLRLKEFIYQFCLYIYIMPLNLTANSNVVGKTVQGLTKIRSKHFEKQVARTCPKKIKLVWICRTSHRDQSLVPATRFWSNNYEFTRWDLSLQLVRESSFNMTRGGWRYWNSKLEILAAPLAIASGLIF